MLRRPQPPARTPRLAATCVCAAPAAPAAPVNGAAATHAEQTYAKLPKAAQLIVQQIVETITHRRSFGGKRIKDVGIAAALCHRLTDVPAMGHPFGRNAGQQRAACRNIFTDRIERICWQIVLVMARKAVQRGTL